jgi:uncharacterized protein CbrC (UPF0167 family)
MDGVAFVFLKNLQRVLEEVAERTSSSRIIAIWCYLPKVDACSCIGKRGYKPCIDRPDHFIALDKLNTEYGVVDFIFKETDLRHIYERSHDKNILS